VQSDSQARNSDGNQADPAEQASTSIEMTDSASINVDRGDPAANDDNVHMGTLFNGGGTRAQRADRPTIRIKATRFLV